MTTVKKRKLNHNSTESILGVPEQNSTGVSPITHTQGNGAVSETRMRTIAGKPLVFLDDRRDLVEVRCYCLKCKAGLGVSVNVWLKISKSHFTPSEYTTGDFDGLKAGDRTITSPEGGYLGGCIVQEYICHSCNKIIGVKCKEATEGKLHYQNRIFLKLGNMTLDKSPSAKAISPQIESTENRTMDYQLEALHSHGRTNFEDVKQLEGELALSSNSGGSMVRPNKSSIDASEALEAQRADIDRISGIVGRIGRDLKHMKALMESMRTEIHSRPLASTISRQDGTLYPVEELELLTANMTSIGAKAGEVDGLKLELEMMKRRIKRLEDANNATQSTATLAALSQETPRHMQMARTMGPIAGPSRLNGPRPPDRDADIEADQLGNVNMEDGDDDGAGTAKISHGGLDTNHKRPRSSTLETLEDTIPDSQRARPDIENVFRPEAESGASEEEITHLARAPVASSSERPVSKPVDPYFSYHAMVIDNPDDDDYRPGSRSTYAQGTRGSPRGRGGGRDVRQGRGGRLRQSLPSHPFVTPEWEKPEWTDEPRSDGGNDVVTTSHRRSTEVLRRGTGGGSFSEPRQAQRRTTAESEERPVDAEGYLLTSNNQQDSRSTMLPRDERQRDAEGYLLTAKGKRDGRSKFWTDVGAGRVPDPRYQSEPGNTSRHTSIMQQIFPNGVEEGRRRSNLAERLFKPNEVRGGEGGELPKVEGE